MAVSIEFVIFGGLAYWLFSDRVRAVIDLILTKLQEVYDKYKWGTQRKPQINDRSFRKEKFEADVKSRLSKKIEKHKPTSSVFNCAKCSSAKHGSLVTDVHNTSAVNILNVENLKCHIKGFMSKLMPQLWQALCFKKYHFTYIYDSVLTDDRIQEVYETAARQSLEDPDVMTDPSVFKELVKKQNQRAANILTTLRSTFSDKILRLSSFVMSRVWMKLFTTVDVDPAQINMLLEAESCKLPLIFLPLHRSHLDYIVITFILANNNIKSPLVAAGENLRIPFFGTLLRGLGAFFIKRRMDPVNGKRDILYRAVLHTYMMQSLKAGHNFEFFIEGGRTRSGKPCMPKGGLLSVFLDALMDGTIEDALLVPVSINYERLVDGNFINEQMGQPKKMESFRSAISAIWKVLTSRYGSMRVDFNQPFSLKELVDNCQNKMSPPTQLPHKKVLHTVPSTASLYGTDVVIEEHRQLVDNIARHVIYDCACSTAAMSTNVVGFLLCTAYRDGVELQELVEALDRLRDELFACNKSLGFSGQSVDVIRHAIKILGPELVKYEINNESKKEIVTPVTKLPNIIELSYYSNSLLPHFVLEAVVVRSLGSLLKSDTNQISRTELLETSLRLCEILQYEFIFSKFCQTLDAAILSTIETLTEKGLIAEIKINLSEEESCDQENKQVAVNENPKVEIQYTIISNHPLLPFYNVILQPFLDVYCISSLQLQSLLSRHVPERYYVEEILQVIKTQLDTGKIKYGESMSVDTIRNSLKLLEKWDVLDCFNKNRVKTYSLGERYDDELSLKHVVTRIEQFL